MRDQTRTRRQARGARYRSRGDTGRRLTPLEPRTTMGECRKILHYVEQWGRQSRVIKEYIEQVPIALQLLFVGIIAEPANSL